MTFLKTNKLSAPPLVIEVEKRKSLDPEAKKSVQTLQHHVGFQYLMQKLDLEKSYLQGLLQGCERDQLEKLQAGIFWINYLKNFMAREGAASLPQAAPALDHEIAAFNEVNRNLEIVGA